MLSDETFLRAILADPADDAPWLIYADWLEERGDPRAAPYRNPRRANALGMRLVLVPRGTFWMGSEQFPDAKPVHKVYVDSFWTDRTEVTNAGLKELKDLTNLAALDLSGTKATDAGLKEIRELKKLSILSLDNRQVTDVGLKELSDLKSLTALRLREKPSGSRPRQP